jgi:TonB-dependent starch-binding outer membrane protein SusC
MFRKRFAHPLGPVMCVLALMLCSMTAYAQNARGRNITGTVLDIDANPVANATVTVAGGGPSATTAADGTFKLAGVATANVVLEVTAEGFTAKQIPVLGAATALQVSVTIVKPVAAAPPPAPPAAETRMVGGVVTDASRAPVAGATVRVQGTQIQVITAADGSFTLPGVATAEATLEISAPNQPATTVAVPADKAVVAVTLGTSTGPAAPATRTVRGTVIDPTTSEPIVAAQVSVASTGAVVFTDADGAFVIEGVPPGALRLDVTAPERESRILEVAAGADTVNVPLALSRGEQIVIEGRAPVIVKTNLASGASVIDDKDLNRVSAQHLDAAMTAKVSGSNLQSNSGAPGGGSQLRLRGISTINGQASPLYVVDGVIISNVSIPSGANAITAAAAGGNASNQDNPVNRLADLNPNDIETLEVLKGASAAALYGSKASNGVVVITTKRGRAGENRATVTQRVGISQVSKKLGSRTFGSVDEVKAAFCNRRQTPEECDASALVQAFNAANGETWNHEDEVLRTPFAMETIASVSGGNQSGNYYGSAMISDNPGVVIGTFYEKQTGRIAVGYNFSDRVRLGITANLVHSLSDRGLTNNDNTGTSNYVVLASTPSFVNLLPDSNGVYPRNPAIGSAANSIQTVNLLQNREDVWRLIGGATLGIDAYSSTDGRSKLRLLSNFGADNFQQKNNLLSPNELLFEPRTDGLPGTSIDASTTNVNWNAGAGAVWSYRPASGGFRSALSGGLTYEAVDTNSVYVIAQDLNAGQPNVTSGVVLGTNQGRLSTKDAGAYVQEELSLLDEQLSVLGGLLGERSSLNGDTGKFFLYPKVAAVFSLIKPGKEQAGLFAKLETLRVRGAYGEAGNRPNYGQKFTPLNATNTIDGNPALTFPGIAGDPDIEPERQREFEVGADMASKDQRVAVELTGYYRGISNLILQRQVAPSTGFVTQFTNAGAMRNIGIEAALSVRPVATKSLDWTSRATFTLNRSKITDLAGNPSFDSPNAGFGAGLGAFRIEEGKSATQIVSTFDPDDPNAVVVVGDGEPDFRIGWSNVIASGDFTFSALLDWQQGSEVINLTRLLYDGARNSSDVEAATMRFTSFVNSDPRPYIEDASFLKLRELSVAYNLPRRLASQVGPLKTLQVSLSGRNLLTFSPYTGLDPEVSNFASQPIGRNYDVAPYPPSRSFWLSLTAGI